MLDFFYLIGLVTLFGVAFMLALFIVASAITSLMDKDD